MSYTFINHREQSPDYPDVSIEYKIHGDFYTHTELCDEFYYFLKGCGFIFGKDVTGIGTIE